MPLPGGPANKLGNRYERLWTVDKLLCLLDGESENIRLEEPGVDKAEFVIRKGVNTEFHQVKYSGMSASWTVASLDSKGVLQAIHDFLSDSSNASFVFVSSCAANELRELCDAARNAESEEEFLTKFIEADARYVPFKRICTTWNRDPSTVFQYLCRIEVRTIGARDLEEEVRHHARALFLADSNKVVAQLLRIVDDFVHKTLRRDDLIEVMCENGFIMRRVSGQDQAVAAIRQTTASYLHRARRRLIHQELLPRTATQAALEGVANSATVLVGKAGSGKTACVVEIVEELLKRPAEVLAFRLDTHVSSSNTSNLGKDLGLEESPVLVLAAAAEKSNRAGVLVLDQLDAVSTMSGRSSEALDLVQDLLSEAMAIRKRIDIHVIVVCRKFDWDNDHRLRRLIHESDAHVTVEEFSDEETQSLLLQGGFNPSLFRQAQLRLLRNPQNLALFFDTDFDVARTPNFNTVTELFDQYWDEKRKLVVDRAGQSRDYWEVILQSLCEEMTAAQELSVRREVIDSVPLSYRDQMESEGVLVSESNRYGFGHESFFDYCYARVSFLTGPESLTSMLCASEQHLFRRAQVRQVLAYIRDADFNRYTSEVAELLAEPRIRAHIKDLVFALLAEVPDPTEDEWRIWNEWTEPSLRAIEIGSPCREMLCELALRRLISSNSWFKFLVSRGVVEQWLKSENDLFLDLIVRDYLRIHATDSPDTAARLLEPFLDSGNAWDERLGSFATWVDASGSRRLFDFLLRLLDSGTLDDATGPIATNSTFWDIFHGLDSKRPEWVGEVVAHRIRRRLNVLTDSDNHLRRGQLLDDDYGVAEMFINAAEAAPLQFVEYVLPVILEVTDLTAYGDPPQRDEVWPFLIRTEHPNAEDGCLEALTRAMTKLTKVTNEAQCYELIDELRRRDTHISNHLLLALYRGAADRFGNDAANTLCSEAWRFDCGYTDSTNWCAMETISMVAPCLAPDRLSLLEDAILDYFPQFENTIEGRRSRGFAQFALLSAIPPEELSEKARLRFHELERKFGDIPKGPEKLTAQIVGSPISDANAQKMTDAQWLRAIKRYSNEATSINSDTIVGGARELSRVLEDCVKSDPERFARLAMQFDANTNPAYMQRTLDGLSHAESISNKQLIIDVIRRAYVISRTSYGGEIADAIGRVSGILPDDVTDMIGWLATKHPDPEIEQWQQIGRNGQEYWNGDPYTHGFGTVRGRAALSIRKLILSDPSNLNRLRGTLERMIQDWSSAVLSCVASIFEAIAVTNPQEASRLFHLMHVPTVDLLATPHVFKFMKYLLVGGFAELNPLIERMICSENIEVANRGAILAGLALLHGHEAEMLVSTALQKGEAQRKGIASVASSNLTIPEYREWCEPRLVELFEDESAKVRREASSCFRRLEEEPLDEYENLVDKFSLSKAFEDDSASILRVLENSRQRLPGMTCLVCRRHLERFSEQTKDMKSSRALDAYTLAKLVFRTYQQHQKDEWSNPALDVIDQLCLTRLAGTTEQLNSFER